MNTNGNNGNGILNFNNMNSKFLQRLFRQVDNAVWDLMTGKIGISTPDGIVTLEETEAGYRTNINMIEQFGMGVPAFAQATPLEAVKIGDLIYADGKPKGWVIEIKGPAKAKSAGVKGKAANAEPTVIASRFVLMSPSGTESTWTPPSMSMLGFDSGVMVLRSLLNMLPSGQAGLGQMQGMLGPMMMAGMFSDDSGKGGVDIGEMLPMMLMMQMGGLNGAGQPADANAMGGMGNMFMMMAMMKKMGGGKGNSFF